MVKPALTQTLKACQSHDELLIQTDFLDFGHWQVEEGELVPSVHIFILDSRRVVQTSPTVNFSKYLLSRN